MAAIDPVAFVRSLSPFDALPAPLWADVAATLDVAYQPAGTWLVRAGGERLRHLWVVRKGAVRLEREGRTLQVIEEGETFGYTSLLTGVATLDVRVEEDLVAIRLPAAAFQRLREADAGFAAHFAAGLAARLRASLSPAPAAAPRLDLSQPVAALLRRPAAWIAPEASVGDAARVMRAERISSLLVRGEPPGIVTDQDFQDRVLAEGLGPDVPVARVCSRPLRTLAASAPLHEAWTALLDLGVHHLPVVEEGEIRGVLTASDLLRATAHGPVALLRRLDRLAGRQDLADYPRWVAELARTLLAARLPPEAVGGLVSRLDDALVRRLVGWAEAELGPAPAPWAFVALGAEARREQALPGPQEAGLIFAEAGASARGWYQALADRLGADLAAAGFARPEAPLDAHRRLGTLAEWVARLRVAVDEGRPHEAVPLLDVRRVAGRLDLAPLEAERSRAGRTPRFLRLLARDALQLAPPGAVALAVRAGAQVDLWWQGAAPVVHLARCHALDVGSAALGTVERLEAAARGGLVAEETHAAVAEAYRFLQGLRLRRALAAAAAGAPASDRVAPADLAPLERTRLKDAARAVERWQERAAYHYQTDLA